MKKVIVSMLAVAGMASVSTAQTYENDAQGNLINAGRLTFQVFNPVTNAWQTGTGAGQRLVAAPGQRVEVRVIADYIGTRTDLFAMGEVLYQPTFSNADNVDGGNGVDNLGAWRNGGNGGNAIAGSMLTAAEGDSGAPLADYGRVRFGGTATAVTGSNTMTSFRHSGGSDGAPAGSWIRAAGSFVTFWPQPLPGTTDATNINRILRGISSQQQSQALAPAFHVAGTSGVVIFRHAIILSNDPAGRILEFSSFTDAIRRVGGTTSTDNRRYMTWQTGAADSGSHRTGVAFQAAGIEIVPTPASAVLLGLGGLIAARRRRA
jgi:hypothetical protein